MLVVQQGREPDSSDLWDFSGDIGNLWQLDLGAKQRELNIKQKLGTLQLVNVM